MPRAPRRMIEEDDESTPVKPRRRAPRRPVESAASPLEGGIKILAIATLLVGSCSGLSAGFEAMGQSSDARYTQTISTGVSKTKIVLPTQDNTIATVGVGIRLLYVLLCLVAVGFAWAALQRTTGFDAKAAVAYLAAPLGVLRLVISWIDYTLIEQAVEMAREALRKTAGYSAQGSSAAFINHAEDLGMTVMIWLGVATAIYWAVTSVSFWPTKEEPGAIDRMA